jgi:hypothetical protein
VDSSCEEVAPPSRFPVVDTGGPPLILIAGVALVSAGLLLGRDATRFIALYSRAAL